MNGREMFRQSSAKQRNAQTKARQPNKQMVDIAGTETLAARAAKGSFSSNGNNAKDND